MDKVPESTKQLTYTWEVVESHKPEIAMDEYEDVGRRGFAFEAFVEDRLTMDYKEYNYLFLRLLKLFWPGKWKEQLRQMNKHLKKNLAEVSKAEWWTFIGLIVASGSFGVGGARL